MHVCVIVFVFYTLGWMIVCGYDLVKSCVKETPEVGYIVEGTKSNEIVRGKELRGKIDF